MAAASARRGLDLEQRALLQRLGVDERRGAPAVDERHLAHVHRQPGDRVHLVRLRVNLAASS